MPADNIFVSFQSLQVGLAILCGNLIPHMEQLPDIFIIV